MANSLPRDACDPVAKLAVLIEDTNDALEKQRAMLFHALHPCRGEPGFPDDEALSRAAFCFGKREGPVLRSPGQSWRIKGIFEAWQFMVNAGLMTGSHVTKDSPPGMLGGFFALPACDGTEPPASPRKERNTFLKIV